MRFEFNGWLLNWIWLFFSVRLIIYRMFRVRGGGIRVFTQCASIFCSPLFPLYCLVNCKYGMPYTLVNLRNSLNPTSRSVHTRPSIWASFSQSKPHSFEWIWSVYNMGIYVYFKCRPQRPSGSGSTRCITVYALLTIRSISALSLWMREIRTECSFTATQTSTSLKCWALRISVNAESIPGRCLRFQAIS